MAAQIKSVLTGRRPHQKKRHQWTHDKLKELWGKSNLPGVTSTSLAKEYGITRQAIEKQLTKASDQFSKTKKRYQ
jgi:hypothetical protein